MAQEQRSVLPIAPAATHADPPRDGDAKPPSRVDAKAAKPVVKGLSISKQWVLPPRPKPGRKPKPRPPKVERHTVKTRSPATVNSPGIAKHTERPAATADGPGGSQKPAGEAHDHDEACGFCIREDCVCEAIGIKDAPAIQESRKRRLPSLETILNSHDVKMDAVPLRRPTIGSARTNGNGSLSSSGTDSHISDPVKFRKIEGLDPIHPRPTIASGMPMQLDSGPTGQPDGGCGFCTENTPCACSDAVVNPPQAATAPPPQPQPVIARLYTDSGPPSTLRPPVSATAPSSAHSSAHASPQAAHSTPASVGVGLNGSGHTAHGSETVNGGRQTPGQAVGSPLYRASFNPNEPLPPPAKILDDNAQGCVECEKSAMSMLFCLSLGAASQLSPGAVAIPCNLAFKTLQKHSRFDECDLGKLVGRLEVNSKMVGVQSISRVLQDMDRGDFTTHG